MTISKDRTARAAKLSLALLFAALVSGCAEHGLYPMSGDECGPDDPVLTMDPAGCGAL